MNTKRCRALCIATVVMGLWTAALLYGTYRSSTVQLAVFHSAMAFIAVTIGCTTALAAMISAHLRPMAVAWHLGMRAAQRKAVEERTHLKAVD